MPHVFWQMKNRVFSSIPQMKELSHICFLNENFECKIITLQMTTSLIKTTSTKWWHFKNWLKRKSHWELYESQILGNVIVWGGGA